MTDSYGFVGNLSMSKPPIDPTAPHMAVALLDVECIKNGQPYDDILFRRRFHFDHGEEIGPVREIAQRLVLALENGINSTTWGYDKSGESTAPEAAGLNSVLHFEVQSLQTHGEVLERVVAVGKGLMGVFEEMLAQQMTYGELLAAQGEVGATLPAAVVSEAPESAPKEVVMPAPKANAQAGA